MSSLRRVFYQYLGLHSLLIGIFPFYIPVFLWKQGFHLTDICIFISLSGVGFCIGLWCWDRIRLFVSMATLIGFSLVLGILLLINMLLLESERSLFISLALIYGFYNAVYWTTQRALFFGLIDSSQSGRKYGNFQIFVGALLQVGIVIGGFLLQTNNLISILFISSLISVVGFLVMLKMNKLSYPATLTVHDRLSFKQIIRFKDQARSRTIFLLDGFFLFAESFFWLITLFLLARESFATLGLLVLSLAVVFFVLFLLLKNFIDRIGQKYIYYIAVIFYAVSWLLRGFTDESLSIEILFVLLVFISFFTFFFRLVMNKRFFDWAKQTLAHDYLMFKSYFSQTAIALIFALLAFVVFVFEYEAEALLKVYWVAAVFALLYFLYRIPRYEK